MMNKETDLLFAYGTLMKGFDNPTAKYLHSTQVFLGEASFAGVLFKVSFYPGAVHLPDADTRVYGHLFQVKNNPEELFARLDEYEGVGFDYGTLQEFKKEVIPIQFSEKTVHAITYLYNIPYQKYPILKSGYFKE